MKKDSSDREARNVQRSLALRMERDWPAAAAAVLNALPELREGTLVLFFGPHLRASYRVAKQLERAMRYYTDATVEVKRVRRS